MHTPTMHHLIVICQEVLQLCEAVQHGRDGSQPVEGEHHVPQLHTALQLTGQTAQLVVPGQKQYSTQ